MQRIGTDKKREYREEIEQKIAKESKKKKGTGHL